LAKSKYAERFEKAKRQPLTVKAATQLALQNAAGLVESMDLGKLYGYDCRNDEEAALTEGQRLAVNYIRMGAKV
jgi:hypothetical protein